MAFIGIGNQILDGFVRTLDLFEGLDPLSINLAQKYTRNQVYARAVLRGLGCSGFTVWFVVFRYGNENTRWGE